LLQSEITNLDEWLKQFNSESFLQNQEVLPAGLLIQIAPL